MPPVAALHAAARRYCIDRAQMWRMRYGEERAARESAGRYPPGMYGYVPEDYAVFPRYNVLDAILWEVERIEPDNVGTVHELRDRLVRAGKTAESLFTGPPNEQASVRAMDEERDNFCVYVTGLSESALHEVDSLPYRRVLGVAESQRLWSALAERWGADGDYWHPLIADELPSGVVVFQQAWFNRHIPTDSIRRFLSERGIGRLWELREGGSEQGMPEYEVELALFEPMYDGRGGFWTSGPMDWLIYVSHESSVTVAGEWLLEAVKSSWPMWQEHIYNGWDYEQPDA